MNELIINQLTIGRPILRLFSPQTMVLQAQGCPVDDDSVKHFQAQERESVSSEIGATHYLSTT